METWKEEETEVGIKVSLEHYEMAMAAKVGLERNLRALERRLQHNPPLLNNSYAWMNHIESAGSECAVGKWLGIFWDGSYDTFMSGYDVGNYQVKWISKPDNALRIPFKANPRHVHILVRGAGPHYELMGWLRAKDGMHEHWISNPQGRGAEYFIPQINLNDMVTLPDE